jgi:hypothetical protein
MLTAMKELLAGIDYESAKDYYKNKPPGQNTSMGLAVFVSFGH